GRDPSLPHPRPPAPSTAASYDRARWRRRQPRRPASAQPGSPLEGSDIWPDGWCRQRTARSFSPSDPRVDPASASAYGSVQGSIHHREAWGGAMDHARVRKLAPVVSLRAFEAAVPAGTGRGLHPSEGREPSFATGPYGGSLPTKSRGPLTSFPS